MREAEFQFGPRQPQLSPPSTADVICVCVDVPLSKDYPGQWSRCCASAWWLLAVFRKFLRAFPRLRRARAHRPLHPGALEPEDPRRPVPWSREGLLS